MRICQDNGCHSGDEPCPTPHLCDGWEPVDLRGILIRLLWPVGVVGLVWLGFAAWRAF